MQDIDLHLGRRLHARRKAMGLTLKALAHESGIPLQQIQKYECAANHMSAGQLWRLAAALEIEASYFYDGLPGLQTGPSPRARMDPTEPVSV